MSAKHTVTLRVHPTIHAALKAQADSEGLTLNRWIQESLLLRVGYNIGVAAGQVVPSEWSAEQDRLLRDLVVEQFAALLPPS